MSEDDLANNFPMNSPLFFEKFPQCWGIAWILKVGIKRGLDKGEEGGKERVTKFFG